MQRILFVDDESKLLDGLKRMLYPFRKEWQTEFVTSGPEALHKLAGTRFDVLVTDLRMPEMSGFELLSLVAERHPEVIRIVLSGMAERESTLASVMLAHQYLDKPCSAAELRAVVDRALKLRIMLADPRLKEVISRIHSLPSVPAVYIKLIKAVQSPDIPTREIGAIIGQDLAMTAKILQLVNSAVFGVRRQITNPTDAVVYLGIDTVRALALTISAFSQFDGRLVPGFSVERLRDHSLSVAAVARQIAKSLELPDQQVEEAFLGGLLHELGRLVLACNYPKEYAAVIRASEEKGAPVRPAELETFGTSHAQVGAYLLWLWGLPDAITDIVARCPQPGPENASGPLVAVHVADALLSDEGGENIDQECLAAMGVIDHLPAWKRLHALAVAEVSTC